MAIRPAAQYDSSLVKGSVTDSIVCNNDKNQTYALYLPTYYNPGKAFPCIYFFDAHARGAMPLRAYRELAEKYSFVLIGSDVSKNGMTWEQTNEIVKVLMTDTRSRMNIDPKRIYTSGFSGGSRVASSVAIFDRGVAGVIGCAAGFPKLEQGLQNKFDYFGIVGDYDFNITEMKRLDDMLAQNGISHQLLTYTGPHGWAPAIDFEAALLWMQVNAMKENLQPKNDTLIKAFKTGFDKRIAASGSSGDWIKVRILTEGVIRGLDGLIDVSTYRKQSAELAADMKYKNALAMQGYLQQAEMGQQQELASQFSTQNEKWWLGKIAELNQKIRSAKTRQESDMNRRLLNYLGLVAYLNSNQAINTGDLSHAASYLKVFKMADPKNPDCPYLSAIYFMKTGNQQQAIASLNEAEASGYSDVSQLNTEPAFVSLRNDESFKSVLRKVLNNYSSK